MNARNKKNRPHTVFYFQRSKLWVYLPNKKTVAALEFPPTILSDVQVIDIEQFSKAITKTLAQYSAQPGSALVILATEICFTKVVPSELANADELLSLLRSSMPFSNVFARMIKLPKQKIAVGLNRDFFEPLLKVLRDQSYDVTTMVPEVVLDQPMAQALSPERAVSLGEQISKLEEFDLLENKEKKQLITTTAQTPEDKKTTLLLASIFVLLLAVFGFVYWWVNRPPATPKPIVPIVPPVVEPLPAMSPSPEQQPQASDEATISSNSAGLVSMENDLVATTVGTPTATASGEQLLVP